ncbi:MAG: exo-alpha-sialidase [Bacteroidia bacterium]|nr:exo-alpha-sialidase [Bacteroidia bacterium]
MKKMIFTFYLIPILLFGLNAQENINLSALPSFDGEPSIAINPVNPDNIIAGWMRLKLDGKIWIATKASFDGGQSWSSINYLPHDTIINGSADVNIVFHNSGTAYLSYINFRVSPDTVGAIFLTRSTNGGITWEVPCRIIGSGDTPDLPFDRPWIAVDNSGGIYDGTVYLSVMSVYWYPGQHHIYLRSTSDGGATWSSIRQVDDSLFSMGTMKVSYAPISIDADGKVYLTYFSYNPQVSPYIRQFVATTTDTGNTFQRYVAVNIFPLYAKLPFYTISADPVNPGNAIIAWCDTRFGDLDILLSKTGNGGQSWTEPVRVNDDPVNTGIVQDQVWSFFSPSGTLALAWRDRRINDTSSTSPFDIYTAVSTDGGVSFEPNIRLSDVSSPYSALSCCNSFIGVALTDNLLVSAWGDFRNSNWDIYFSKSDIITETEKTIQTDKYDLRVFPNPNNSETVIQFTLNKNQLAELKLLDDTGKEIKSLIRKELMKGEHSVILNMKSLSPGVYYIVLVMNSNISTKKMMVINK